MSSDSATAADRGRASRWKRHGLGLDRLLIAFALVATAVVAMSDAWGDMLHIALRDSESSQVILAPVVAAWLFWVRRGRLRNYEPSVVWLGPLFVCVGWALYAIGDRHLIQSFWHFGAIVVAVGCFISLAGGGFLLRFLPAFGALCFMVPVPGRLRQFIAQPLQTATATVTGLSLDTLGFEIERLGNVLRINNQDVLIAEACNGLRMVFALMIVSYAFAYGTPLRNGTRALVVLLSPLTAIVFNVFRLVPVVWGFGNFSPEVAAMVHDASAWVMLPCSFLALLGVMRLMKWARIPISPYILAYGS